MLELYHDWRSFCSIKVRICLAEKQLPWTSRFVDLMNLEHTRPEYLSLNPNGVVPTLVHDGVPIVESTVINEYLEDVFPEFSLVPANHVERARMRAWVKFEDDVLHPSIRPATFMLMMGQELAQLSDEALEKQLALHPNQKRADEYRKVARSPVDTEAVDSAKQLMRKAIERMDSQLTETPWLAGDTYSLADVAAAPFVDRLEQLNFVGLWEDKPGLVAWIDRLKARDSYSESMPREDQRFSVRSAA